MSVSHGQRIVTLTDYITPNVASPIATPGMPGRRIIAFLGDSNTRGFNASSEAPSGWRYSFSRRLRAAGVDHRMVGTRGFTAINSTGASWGGPNPDPRDFQDADGTGKFALEDWRNDGQSGQKMSESITVTSVQTTGSGDTLTSNGHGYADGSLVVLTSTGTLPTITGLSPVTVNGVQYLLGFAKNTTTNTWQMSLLDNGAALPISAAGSGTITAAKGLLELLPAIYATWDATPTDVVWMCGTNDIAAGIDASTPSLEAALETRENAVCSLLDTLLPNALKHRWGVFPFTPGISSQAAKQAAVVTFNAYLATVGTRRGPKWAYVDVGSEITGAQMQSDGTHPVSFGYELVGRRGADAFIASRGSGSSHDVYPFVFRKRAQQACIYLNATNAVLRFPAQSSLNPGSDNFFFGCRYFPTAFASGTNAIIQQENPFNTGSLLSCTNNDGDTANLLGYWKQASPAIVNSALTKVLKRLRWHQLFVFCSFSRQLMALWVNGRLVQRTPCSAAAITSSTGWYLGGSSLSSALGLYMHFIQGHSSTMDIEDAGQWARLLYAQGVDPPGTTAKYLCSEGTGTSVAGIGTAGALTAGTLTNGAWIAAGDYPHPVDVGYRRLAWDMHPDVQTGAYTPAWGESVRVSPPGGGQTNTIPTAVGHRSERIHIKNVGSNALTLATTSAQTIDGSAPGTLAAGASLTLESDGANLISI